MRVCVCAKGTNVNRAQLRGSLPISYRLQLSMSDAPCRGWTHPACTEHIQRDEACTLRPPPMFRKQRESALQTLFSRANIHQCVKKPPVLDL